MKNYWIWIVVAIIVVVAGIWYMNGSSFSGVGGSAAVGNAAAAQVTTSASASFSKGGVVLVGTVNAGGSATTYWFEYGPTMSFGSSTAPAAVGKTSTTLPVSAVVPGLKKNTNYFFRLGAKNAAGTVYGAPYNFITPAQ